MNEIEHRRVEVRPNNHIWWIVWPIIAFAWAGSLYLDLFDWHSIFLGAFTGMALATFALEKSKAKADR